MWQFIIKSVTPGSVEAPARVKAEVAFTSGSRTESRFFSVGSVDDLKRAIAQQLVAYAAGEALITAIAGTDFGDLSVRPPSPQTAVEKAATALAILTKKQAEGALLANDPQVAALRIALENKAAASSYVPDVADLIVAVSQ